MSHSGEEDARFQLPYRVNIARIKLSTPASHSWALISRPISFNLGSLGHVPTGKTTRALSNTSNDPSCNNKGILGITFHFLPCILAKRSNSFYIKNKHSKCLSDERGRGHSLRMCDDMNLLGKSSNWSVQLHSLPLPQQFQSDHPQMTSGLLGISGIACYFPTHTDNTDWGILSSHLYIHPMNAHEWSQRRKLERAIHNWHLLL